jgi:SAM-dependent methyltransferase
MLSDGRICPRPLEKSICLACGAVSYTTPQSVEDIHALYDGDYNLGAAPGAADLHRNTAYADFIAGFLDGGPSRHILEVGCGSGQTLAALIARFPVNTFAGIEAAEQLAVRGHDNLHISQAFVEELKPPTIPYDLVYSINVIEHAADPLAFLTAVAGQLTLGGTCIIICPASHPANLELLFRDHVTTFTPQAITAVAMAAGFTVTQMMPTLPKFAGFQAVILTLQEAAAVTSSPAVHYPTADADAAKYLTAWAELDDRLLKRVGDRTVVHFFGAGEIAALLRCYSPRLWDRVQTLVVDDLSGARQLGRPVVALADLTANSAASDAAIIVAVHPRAQSIVSKKLMEKGLFPICFDDIIVC